MTPIQLDDLIPLGEFAARRTELFRAHARYLDRYRRVRIGPRSALVFENRQTLWFRAQEVIRIARLTDPKVIQRELDWLNRLIPPPGVLAATWVMDIPDSELGDQLEVWAAIPGDAIQIRAGDESLASAVFSSRPGDRLVGLTHWLTFAISEPLTKMLNQRRLPVTIVVNHAGYVHEAELDAGHRQSLRDDLESAERSRAA